MLSPLPNEDGFASVLSMPGLRWSPSLRDQVKDRLNRGVWRDELIHLAEYILCRALGAQRLSDDAEEIWQEYNANRLDRHLDTFDPARGRFEAFLPRWFGYFCQEQAKELLLRRTLEVDMNADARPTAAEGLGGQKEMTLIAPLSYDPAARQRYQELLDLIQACLTPGEFEVFMLHHIDGYKFDEIAAMLGKKEGATRLTHHRAKHKLRDRLDDEGYL